MNSDDSQPDWRSLNRANWDERVPIHLGPRGYDVAGLLNGRAQLNAIEEAELGPVIGLRVLHLQCHFGLDTLILVQRGATAVGLDFSAPAIDAARDLAVRLGLTNRVKFVHADLYDAIAAIPESSSFDAVFVTWGALPWLPDVAGWARTVAHFLKPGGWVYLAEGHPAGLVLDDEQSGLPEGMPGFFVPYFHDQPLLLNDATDYMDPDARLTHTATCQWIHPVGEVVTSLIDAGLHLDWLHEHPAVTWRMFGCLVKDHVGLYRWPDKPWLPLAYSLHATKPQV